MIPWDDEHDDDPQAWHPLTPREERFALIVLWVCWGIWGAAMIGFLGVR